MAVQKYNEIFTINILKGESFELCLFSAHDDIRWKFYIICSWIIKAGTSIKRYYYSKITKKKIKSKLQK